MTTCKGCGRDMENRPVNIEILYGFRAARPHWACRITAPPDPTAADILRGIFRELIVPAFLFALAVTAFKFALLGHF